VTDATTLTIPSIESIREHAIATRGSFHSHQAGWATNWLRARLGPAPPIPDNLTLLFEIISPVSHIVVDYQGREECVLLSVRDCFNAADWPHAMVRELAQELGLSVVPTDDSIEDVHQAMTRRRFLNVDREGWVIRCAGGQRWQVKCDYVALHRLLCHLSERAMVDARLEDRADELLSRLPPEYPAQATTWRDEFERLVADGQSHLAAIFAEAPKATRKEFALWAKANHPESMHYLFRMLDGKETRTPLLEALRERVSVQPVVSPNE
jgi:hypothetical protein